MTLAALFDFRTLILSNAALPVNSLKLMTSSQFCSSRIAPTC